MENINKTSEHADVIDAEKITAPMQGENQHQVEKENNLQEMQPQEPQQQEQRTVKELEIPGEKQGEKQINQEYVEEEDDDYVDDDGDDDEEKDTSRKLIIDIPEEDDEKEDDEDDNDDVIASEELPPHEVTQTKGENNRNTPKPKPEEVSAIITLSDVEEDIPVNEVPFKSAKVQKRRSAGPEAVGGNDEEGFRLKRRKINVAGAPKMPLTGYVRYMNDRRESLRKEHPSKTSIEHTKMIGEEWHSLPLDVKSSYLKAADADKQRYVKELNTFLKSRPDVLASELAKNKIRKTAENNNPNPSTIVTGATATATAIATATVTNKQVLKEKSQISENTKSSKDTTARDKRSKENVPTPSTSQQATDNNRNVQEKTKRKRTPTPPTTNTNISNSVTATANTTIVTPAPGEIPIFTNEFLEHNKIYDMELRSLRKSKTDLEQQNSLLEKHVENMKFGVEKMITENNQLEEKNRLLEIYLDKLKRKLALALASLPLPSAPNGATVENINDYMQDLYKMSTSNSHGPATLNKAKDIIRKLDLQIQL